MAGNDTEDICPERSLEAQVNRTNIFQVTTTYFNMYSKVDATPRGYSPCPCSEAVVDMSASLWRTITSVSILQQHGLKFCSGINSSPA